MWSFQQASHSFKPSQDVSKALSFKIAILGGPAVGKSQLVSSLVQSASFHASSTANNSAIISSPPTTSSSVLSSTRHKDAAKMQAGLQVHFISFPALSASPFPSLPPVSTPCSMQTREKGGENKPSREPTGLELEVWSGSSTSLSQFRYLADELVAAPLALREAELLVKAQQRLCLVYVFAATDYDSFEAVRTLLALARKEEELEQVRSTTDDKSSNLANGSTGVIRIAICTKTEVVSKREVSMRECEEMAEEFAIKVICANNVTSMVATTTNTSSSSSSSGGRTDPYPWIKEFRQFLATA